MADEDIDFFSKNLLHFKLVDFIFNINPIFIFRFNKIDKKIWKYSRGKSGRYKCVFKYIPVYKRLNFIFLVFKKDFIFSKIKKFKQKLSFLIYSLVINHTSLVFNIKRFANFYFFNNTSVFRIK